MKLFIWDFHGTLEQGNELAVLEMSNTVLEKNGFKERFTIEKCQNLYGKKWHEYFEHLLPNQLPNLHLKLQRECFAFSIANPQIIAKYIKPVNYSLEVLESIKKENDQILVSNTKPKSLKIFMESVGITHIFPKGKAFATNSHIKHKSKLEIVKKYLYAKDYHEIITIGDSPEDVEFGLKIGAKTFLYTHPGQAFKSSNPHYKINDLREILKFV